MVWLQFPIEVQQSYSTQCTFGDIDKKVWVSETVYKCDQGLAYCIQIWNTFQGSLDPGFSGKNHNLRIKSRGITRLRSKVFSLERLWFDFCFFLGGGAKLTELFY